MKILVTGIPGSGKTTLVNYANSIGNNNFLDSDNIEELSEWREFDTGKIIKLTNENRANNKDEWHKKYGWFWNEDQLTSLLNKSESIILCGSAENVTRFFKLFDKIIILKITREELIKNLNNPQRTNPFGKTDNQRIGLMEWQDFLIKEAIPYNPTIISTNEIKSIYTEVTNFTKT